MGIGWRVSGFWHFPIKFLGKNIWFLSFVWAKCIFNTFYYPRKNPLLPPAPQEKILRTPVQTTHVFAHSSLLCTQHTSFSFQTLPGFAAVHVMVHVCGLNERKLSEPRFLNRWLLRISTYSFIGAICYLRTRQACLIEIVKFPDSLLVEELLFNSIRLYRLKKNKFQAFLRSYVKAPAPHTFWTIWSWTKDKVQFVATCHQTQRPLRGRWSGPETGSSAQIHAVLCPIAFLIIMFSCEVLSCCQRSSEPMTAAINSFAISSTLRVFRTRHVAFAEFFCFWSLKNGEVLCLACLHCFDTGHHRPTNCGPNFANVGQKSTSRGGECTSRSVFPLRKFYTKQMFILVCMQLLNHADAQPVKRFKR